MKFVFWIPQTELSATTTGAIFFCDIMLSHKSKKKMPAEMQHLLEVPGDIKSKKYFYSTTIERVALFIWTNLSHFSSNSAKFISVKIGITLALYVWK